MSRSIVAVITMLLSSVVSAEADRDICLVESRLATTVMEARQSGMSISEFMKASKEVDSVYARIAEEMAIVAYAQPLCATDACATRSATEFGNAWFIACMKR